MRPTAGHGGHGSDHQKCTLGGPTSPDFSWPARSKSRLCRQREIPRPGDFIEAAIISSSLYAGYLFAEKYAGSPTAAAPTEVAALNWIPFLPHFSGGLDWWMAIVGAVMLAACELARIPLAMAFRSHRQFGMRLLAVLGVAAMVLVTTKTVATVLGQAYHVRRVAVIEATADVKLAEADLARIQATRGSADTALAPLQKRVDEANKRIAELNRTSPLRARRRSRAPRSRRCRRPAGTASTPRNGRARRPSPSMCRCHGRGNSWSTGSTPRSPSAMPAVTARDAAAGKVGGEVERVADQEKVVAEARSHQRAAVMNSQLHDFAGVVLGKDAVDVSEEELNWFLRLFILVPALLIAAASTMLAMVAFTRLPKRRETQPIIVQLPAALRGTVNDNNIEPRAA